MISPRRQPRPTFPLATGVLIVANVLAFGYEQSLGEARYASFLGLWGVVPRNLAPLLLGAAPDPRLLVTPLTSMYLHASVVHLAGNVLYLWVFGSVVERRLGAPRFLLFYTFCGLVAAVAQVAAWRDSSIPAIGASGAIAGLLAAYLVLCPGAVLGTVAPWLFVFRPGEAPAVILLALWLLSQALSWAISLGGTASGSSAGWFAHLCGFAGGLVLALIFRGRRRSPYHC